MNSHTHIQMIRAISFFLLFGSLLCFPCFSAEVSRNYCQSPNYDYTVDLYSFCEVAACLDKTGGGFHSLSDGFIHEFHKTVGSELAHGKIEKLRKDRPYSLDFLYCIQKLSRQSEKERKQLQVFYAGIQKIWGCLINDDASCLARYTEKVHLRTTRFLEECGDLAEKNPGQIVNENGMFKTLIAPHLVFTDVQKFYKCIITNKSKIDTYDQRKPETFDIVDYHFLKRLLQSPLIYVGALSKRVVGDQKEYYSLYYGEYDHNGFGPIQREIIFSYDKAKPNATLMINLDLITPPVIQSDLFFPSRCNGCEKSDFYDYKMYMKELAKKDKFYDPKYPNCYLGDLEPISIQNKCHASYCFNKTGGGVNVFTLPVGEKKDLLKKPYSQNYITCTYPRESSYDDFTKQMRSLLYRDLEKLWKCYDLKDIGCIEKLTHFQSIYGDDKWRVPNSTYPKECTGIGKHYQGASLQTEANSSVDSGHYALSKKEYFQCLMNIKTPISFPFSFELHQKYIKSPYIMNRLVLKDKLESTNHQVSFLLTSDYSNEGITLTYGTPANPKGFAITAIGHPYMVGPPDKVKEIEQIEDQKKK